MIFLTILVVKEILYGFRLLLEEKPGKEMPESSRLEFLEEFLANNFVLSDEEDNASGLLNRGDSRFTFVENTISNLHKVPKAKFQGSDGLVFVLLAC